MERKEKKKKRRLLLCLNMSKEVLCVTNGSELDIGELLEKNEEFEQEFREILDT